MCRPPFFHAKNKLTKFLFHTLFYVRKSETLKGGHLAPQAFCSFVYIYHVSFL